MRESLGDRLPLPLCEPPAIERSIANIREPSRKRIESRRILKGLPSPHFSLFPSGLLLPDRRGYTNLRIRILHSKHNHLSTDHSASTRRSLYSIETTYGLACAPIARTSSRNASSAHAPSKRNRHRLYELMQQFQIPERPCNLISMHKFCPPPADSRRLSQLLTAYPRKAYLFQLPTTLSPLVLQIHS